MRRLSIQISKLNLPILFALTLFAGQAIAEDQVKPDPSGITITLGDQGPAELLLTDSKGNRTGVDIHTGDSCKEIPNAHYFSNYIEDPDGYGAEGWKKIDIMRPVSDDYRLTLTGTHEGTYNLTLRAYDIESESSIFAFRKVPIATGEVHSFLFSFDKTKSLRSSVTGGFDGTESIAPEINRFLSYVNITDATTKLPPGTDSTSLFVIYSRDPITEQFTATLNGEDVSALFRPADGKYELVNIPLNEGKNILVLSAFGFTDEAIETDIDSLVFVVE